MPIYEYHCDECQTDFQDLVMSRAAEREVVCKSCGSGNIVKLLSGSAVKSSAPSGGDGPGPGPSFGGGGCGGSCACH